MGIGIEAINAYVGQVCIDVRTLFQARSLDFKRIDNLMMEQKSVSLPCEDVVTNAVNAAKPILDCLSMQEKQQIELVIAATESGLDFGKAITTYIHDYLGLSRRCRVFEIKQACYAGTAALNMAAYMVASSTNAEVKALVISTDTARSQIKMTYAEPSQGTGAVAILVSNKPDILELDLGANGYHSYEVMDTCRPQAEIELGDADLSLASYMDCLEQCYKNYAERVEGADWQTTFDYLIFHTPFAGLVKGAHRAIMRNIMQADATSIERDFQQRIKPGLKYCMRVGNIYSATVYLALCGLIDEIDLPAPKRVGIFSYGSGCSAEFFSGVLNPMAKYKLSLMEINNNLNKRYNLTIEQYDEVLELNKEWWFGIENKNIELDKFAAIYATQMPGKNLLRLERIKNYHREYVWS